MLSRPRSSRPSLIDDEVHFSGGFDVSAARCSTMNTAAFKLLARAARRWSMSVAAILGEALEPQKISVYLDRSDIPRLSGGVAA